MAATRWANVRCQILQGQAPGPAHAASLQQADQVLRMVWAPRLFHAMSGPDRSANLARAGTRRHQQ